MFQLNEAICCECSYFVDCNLLDMCGRPVANGSTLLDCHMLDDDGTIPYQVVIKNDHVLCEM